MDKEAPSYTQLSDPRAVTRAIEEYDLLGEEKFLKKHGYGRAKSYFLVHRGRSYAPKAIVGVAIGYQFPDHGPLTHSVFSSGEKTVVPKLESLGFRVLKENPHALDVGQPIVLTEIEKTVRDKYAWKDVTGEQYHYPNQYRNKVVPGRPFIYYAGKRAGNESESLTYFGTGRIGEVWRDEDVPETAPKSQWHWFCTIEDYIPFSVPVSFRRDDNSYVEDVRHSNHWGTSVRPISADVYSWILAQAGLSGIVLASVAGEDEGVAGATAVVSEDPLSLIRKRKLSNGRHGGSSGGRPYSKDSKEVGDAAERAVFEHLMKTLTVSEVASLRWVSKVGETPGWDMEYTNDANELVAVEVKGTKAPMFASIDISGNEWRAAEKKGDLYYLYLVAEALSQAPVISSLRNPFLASKDGPLAVRPIMWRVEQFED